MENKLYYGDCLTIMRDMPPESVDMIYLDPPFNSNRSYNAIYKDETGRPLPDQVEAFCDLWTLDDERERAIRNVPMLMREAGIDDPVVEFWRAWISALRDAQPRLAAYLSYMTERLLPMRTLLKPTGNIYLHCDPTAAHYIKVMMDTIFGHKNFRNEIIWHYDGSQRPSRKRFGSKHDTILRYSKTDRYFANSKGIAPFQIVISKELETPKKLKDKGYQRLDDGRYYYTTPRGDYTDASIARLDKEDRIERTSSGKVRIRYFLTRDKDGNLGRDKQLHDVWHDIHSVSHAGGNEKLGYATQKPLALLERIINASVNPGDTVLDPFCGCATTIEAAHNLECKWIGIDIAIHAVKRVSTVRLRDRLGLVEGEDYEILGVPMTLEGAQDLWERDSYHFQKWAVEQIDGFVAARKTADGGVDGRLYFEVPGEKDLQSMVLEVKGGANVGIGDVRALRGVLERDSASMAGLIIMGDLGSQQQANFLREMASAGDLIVKTDKAEYTYPRMQLLTIPEILDGKRFSTPSVVGRGERTPILPGVGVRRSRRTSK